LYALLGQILLLDQRQVQTQLPHEVPTRTASLDESVVAAQVFSYTYIQH
jgi:hypothetical protein